MKSTTTNIHSIAFVKRNAKRIKKEQHLLHHDALDVAAHQAGFANWKHFLSEHTKNTLKEQPKKVSANGLKKIKSELLKPGIKIRVKPFKSDAFLLSHNILTDTVVFFDDAGRGFCARHEISVYRDQKITLKPMRLYLPYGKWICEDGTEFLFNRDYKPMWIKQTNGAVCSVDPNDWIPFDKEIHFFGDSNPPWRDKQTFKACLEVLKGWGVLEKTPKTFDSLYEAIKNGDYSL